MPNADTERTLEQVRKHMKFRDLKPIGYCYNPRCNSELGGGRLFCSEECSDEWDEIHGMKQEHKDAK